MVKLQYRPERALVTGGSGFIGCHVVRDLVERGVQVRVMLLPGDAAPNLAALRARVEVVEGDLLDSEALRRALDGCDTLFNLAAIYAIWLPVRRKMFDVNVDGTRRLMQVAKELGVPRIVHTSSIAAIGVNPGTQPADEETRFDQWEADDYVLSKYISELEVQRMISEGLPAVIVNPAFPFGAGDIAPTPTGSTIDSILKGVPFYPAGGFNAVGVRDVARGHILAAESGRVGRRYLLGNENLTYGDFASRVAREAGIRAPRLCLGPRPFRVLGKTGDFIAERITRRQPLASERGVTYTVGRHLYFDISRARQELGYDPAPIEGAIKRAVAWFRAGRKGEW